MINLPNLVKLKKAFTKECDTFVQKRNRVTYTFIYSREVDTLIKRACARSPETEVLYPNKQRKSTQRHRQKLPPIPSQAINKANGIGNRKITTNLGQSRTIATEAEVNCLSFSIEITKADDIISFALTKVKAK